VAKPTDVHTDNLRHQRPTANNEAARHLIILARDYLYGN